LALIDHWVRHIKDVYRFNEDKLNDLPLAEQEDLLCELNVIEQVNNVCESAVVRKAWRKGADLTVHGWIYGIQNGILKNMNVGTDSLESYTARMD
jgi:carbonic anhydrase